MVLVGNYEPYLEYCLKSLEPLVDEIVIVEEERGSCDDLGEAYNIKTPITTIWQDMFCKGNVDFSAWRNECLEQSTGDWILWLDADEVFAWKNGKEVTRKQIESLIKQLEVKGINAVKFLTHHFMYNYFTLDARNNGEHYSMRLFKNDGRRFEKKVHEFINLEPKKTGTIWDMMIWHFGHCKGIEELVSKYKERKIPDNPYTNKLTDKEFKSYLKVNDNLRGTLPLMRYEGKMPEVMGLW